MIVTNWLPPSCSARPSVLLAYWNMFLQFLDLIWLFRNTSHECICFNLLKNSKWFQPNKNRLLWKEITENVQQLCLKPYIFLLKVLYIISCAFKQIFFLAKLKEYFAPYLWFLSAAIINLNISADHRSILLRINNNNNKNNILRWRQSDCLFNVMCICILAQAAVVERRGRSRQSCDQTSRAKPHQVHNQDPSLSLSSKPPW